MATSRKTKSPILDPRTLWVRIRARDLQDLEDGRAIIVNPPPPGEPVVFGHSGGRASAGKGYFLSGNTHHNTTVGKPYFEVRTTEKKKKAAS